MVDVAEMGKEFVTDYDRRDRRLRVIYDNGTESDSLLRSLQRALHKDDAGRRITDPSAGPLFGSTQDAQDTDTGTIYVLRTKSDHPQIAANRELIHKIGSFRGHPEEGCEETGLAAHFEDHSFDRVTSAAFSPDGAFVLAGSRGVHPQDPFWHMGW